jgi:hypothetical protein
MRKSWLLCVLLGTLAWGQAAPGTPPPATPAAVPGNAGQAPSPMARPQAGPPMQQAPAGPDTSASVPDNAAVITITGVCAAQPKTATVKGTAAKPATAATKTAATKTAATKAPAADCKTIITKAEFEKLAGALAPSVTPQVRRQLGGVLPQLVAATTIAEKENLDKTSDFKEKLKFTRMRLLSAELTQNIQKEAAKVPEEQIASYYKEHPDTFELFNLDRLYIPRTKQPDAEGKDDKDKDDDDKGAKLTEEQQKAKQAEEKAKADAAEQAMTQLAETLRVRAAAGEDFAKLQKEAFEAAGMKGSPSVNLPKVRRTALPAAHVGVLELKVGEVSQVLSDNAGHYVYKVNGKDMIPLDQAEQEIHSTLQNQRSRELTEKMNSSYKVVPNEAYFGPGGPGAPPPPRIQNRQNAPMGGRMPPPPQQQTAPPAQTPPPAQAPPPQPPAAKPN